MASAFTPVIFYQDPIAALKWLETAFGFETSMLAVDDAGRVGHAEMTFEDSVLDVGGEWSSAELLGPAAMKSPASLGGAGTQFIRVNVSEIDAHHERARAFGARITQVPTDQFYGARTYRALDLEGHVWNFSQTIAQMSADEMSRASGLKFTTSA